MARNAAEQMMTMLVARRGKIEKTPSPQREAIVAAAIQWKETTFSIPAPARHHHIIYKMNRMGLGPEATSGQGFLTSRGKFVDRVTALAIAVRFGQIKHKKGNPNELYSEDLW